MIVFRLSRTKYAGDLSGKGAEMAGGRWNNRGTPMIYTASNRALCVAEIAVHTPLGIIPKDYVLSILELPDDSVAVLDAGLLTPGWNEFPHRESTQRIGDDFVKGCASIGLRVPSAVVQGEHNILINPRHPDIGKLKILGSEAFSFDERLFGYHRPG